MLLEWRQVEKGRRGALTEKQQQNSRAREEGREQQRKKKKGIPICMPGFWIPMQCSM